MCGCHELRNRKARAIREHIKEGIGECIRPDTLNSEDKNVPYSRVLGGERLGPGKGELLLRLFRSRDCLELRNRTARAIAGHIKEDLSEYIRQGTLT